MILLSEIICIVGFIITVFCWIREFKRNKVFQETLYHFPFMITFIIMFFAFYFN